MRDFSPESMYILIDSDLPIFILLLVWSEPMIPPSKGMPETDTYLKRVLFLTYSENEYSSRVHLVGTRILDPIWPIIWAPPWPAQTVQDLGPKDPPQVKRSRADSQYCELWRNMRIMVGLRHDFFGCMHKIYSMPNRFNTCLLAEIPSPSCFIGWGHTSFSWHKQNKTQEKWSRMASCKRPPMGSVTAVTSNVRWPIKLFASGFGR